MDKAQKTCSKCGTPLGPEARFCDDCGQPADTAPPQAPPPKPRPAPPIAGPGKKAGLGLLIPGYIFAVVGGLIGLAIGLHILRSQDRDALGNRHPKYAKSSRIQGLIISVIAAVVMAVCIGMSKR